MLLQWLLYTVSLSSFCSLCIDFFLNSKILEQKDVEKLKKTKQNFIAFYFELVLYIKIVL